MWMIRVINVRSNGSPFLDDVAQWEGKMRPPHFRSCKDFSLFFVLFSFVKKFAENGTLSVSMLIIKTKYDLTIKLIIQMNWKS
jgi:hypothetical protein